MVSLLTGQKASGRAYHPLQPFPPGGLWLAWLSLSPTSQQSLWLKGFWFASLVHVLTLGTKEVSPGSLESKGLNGITMRWGTWLPRVVCWQTHICSAHGSFFRNTWHLSNDNLLSHAPSKPPKRKTIRRGGGQTAWPQLSWQMSFYLCSRGRMISQAWNSFIARSCKCPVHLLGRMGAPGSLLQGSFTQSEDEC